MSVGRKIEIYAEATESQASETNSNTAFVDVVLSNIKVEHFFMVQKQSSQVLRIKLW